MSPFIQFLYLFTWLAYNIKINRFIDGTLLRWRAIASSHHVTSHHIVKARRSKCGTETYGNVGQVQAIVSFFFNKYSPLHFGFKHSKTILCLSCSFLKTKSLCCRLWVSFDSTRL